MRYINTRLLLLLLLLRLRMENHGRIGALDPPVPPSARVPPPPIRQHGRGHDDGGTGNEVRSRCDVKLVLVCVIAGYLNAC